MPHVFPQPIMTTPDSAPAPPLSLGRHRVPRMAHRAAGLLLLCVCALAPACRGERGRGQQPEPPLAYLSGDAAVDDLQRLFLPTLEANRKAFQGQLGTVRGFGAGDRYPQIWLRDSATLVPLTRYLYPRPFLTSWLEEHLACQQDDGALFDWVAGGAASHFTEWAPRARDVLASGGVAISADKNTTEADQESSAIEAAYQAWRATGDDAWLRETIRGRRLLDRLDDALRYVLTRRVDPKVGLVVNALTADWGDVSPIYPDQRAIYVDDRTPLAAGLYTNALAYRAALRLAEMHAALGEGAAVVDFQNRAASLKDAVNRRLWQEGRGFYRMHIQMTPALARAFPDDADIFALGGNALAVLSGIADDAQAARVFEAAATRQHEHRVSTVAGTLLPPYPAGVFLHPSMAQPWQYQNGGQWDWFAGRLLLAEFARGHAREARGQLGEIARRVARSGDFFEWSTREGEGRGSRRYAGGAGAIGDAIVHGLFGVDLGRGRLDLRIRLAERSGSIRLRQPSTGDRVSYRYTYEAKANHAVLSYEGDAKGLGRLAVLIPDGQAVVDVLRDGQAMEFDVETVAVESYAVVETDWNPHRLDIALAPVGVQAGRRGVDSRRGSPTDLRSGFHGPDVGRRPGPRRPSGG